MIDFGFWGSAPVGFDLTQLLVGEVQVGRRGARDLAELDEAIVAAGDKEPPSPRVSRDAPSPP